MVSDRMPYNHIYKDCYNHSHPLRAGGFFTELFSAGDAKNRTADLFDTTSTDASQVLASSIVNGTTPANAIWFGLDAGQESDLERRWLDDAAKIVWENIHASNFDGSIFECMLDLVDCGYFTLYVDEAEDGGYNFECWHPSEVFLAQTKKGGKVDIVHREFLLTAEQAVAKYGKDNLSEKTKQKAVEKPSELVKFIHCIYPREIYVANAMRSKNLPIASVHIEYQEKKIVKESGYHEMPAITPRWSSIPNSSYSFGQIFNALPAIKELNTIKRLEAANMDMAIAGMWIAEDDGVLNAKTIKVGARKVIVANSVDSMKALTPGTNFDVAFTKEERLQAEIRRIMMADQMPPVEGQPRTATEFYARINFLRQLLGPVFGRYNSEFLQPFVERCFGIAYRAGVLGQAPETLATRAYTVKYLSPLARSQKMEEVSAIQQAYASAAQIAAAKQDGSVFDNLNDDEAMRAISQALGVPNKIERSSDDVDEMRKQRQESQQAQQEQAMMAEMATKVAPTAVKEAMNAQKAA